jgi:hypothetical protein
MKIRGNSKTSHKLPKGEKSRRKRARKALLNVRFPKLPRVYPTVDNKSGCVMEMAKAASARHGKIALLRDDTGFYVMNGHGEVLGRGRTRRGALRHAALGYH